MGYQEGLVGTGAERLEGVEPVLRGAGPSEFVRVQSEPASHEQDLGRLADRAAAAVPAADVVAGGGDLGPCGAPISDCAGSG